MSHITSGLFFIDEGEQHVDTSVLPPAYLRSAKEALEGEKQRFCGVAGEQYATTEEHFNDEVEFAARVSTEGGEVLAEEVLAPLRSGELSPKEAARRVAEMRRDLNKARAALKVAAEREERTWAEVNVSPAEYQRALAGRSPLLFQGGRGLLELPVIQD